MFFFTLFYFFKDLLCGYVALFLSQYDDFLVQIDCFKLCFDVELNHFFECVSNEDWSGLCSRLSSQVPKSFRNLFSMFHFIHGNFLESFTDSIMLNSLPLNMLPHILNYCLKLTSNCLIQHIKNLRARQNNPNPANRMKLRGFKPD